MKPESKSDDLVVAEEVLSVSNRTFRFKVPRSAAMKQGGNKTEVPMYYLDVHLESGLFARHQSRSFQPAGDNVDPDRKEGEFMSRSHLTVLAMFPIIGMLACSAATAAVGLPDPAVDAPLATTKGEQTAVVAGGCFWGVQAVFEHVKGVIRVAAGYSGGSAATAHYEAVCSDTTG
jgi:hypothetical protein